MRNTELEVETWQMNTWKTQWKWVWGECTFDFRRMVWLLGQLFLAKFSSFEIFCSRWRIIWFFSLYQIRLGGPFDAPRAGHTWGISHRNRLCGSRWNRSRRQWSFQVQREISADYCYTSHSKSLRIDSFLNYSGIPNVVWHGSKCHTIFWTPLYFRTFHFTAFAIEDMLPTKTQTSLYRSF